MLVKRAAKTTKYQSVFDNIPYTVTDVQGSRYELVKESETDNSWPIFRHINDIKPYKGNNRRLQQHHTQYIIPESFRPRRNLLGGVRQPTSGDETSGVQIAPADVTPVLSPRRSHDDVTATPTCDITQADNAVAERNADVRRSSRTSRIPKKFNDHYVELPDGRIREPTEEREWCCIHSDRYYWLSDSSSYIHWYVLLTER